MPRPVIYKTAAADRDESFKMLIIKKENSKPNWALYIESERNTLKIENSKYYSES